MKIAALRNKHEELGMEISFYSIGTGIYSWKSQPIKIVLIQSLANQNRER